MITILKNTELLTQKPEIELCKVHCMYAGLCIIILEFMYRGMLKSKVFGQSLRTMNHRNIIGTSVFKLGA